MTRPRDAGTLAVWRRRYGKGRPRGGELGVLLVRDAAGKWRWPAAVPESAALAGPTASVREAREDLGASVVAGLPLTGAVRAATLRSADVRLRPGPRAREVAWLAPEQAAQRLELASERSALEALLAAAEDGRLAARPLVVARHAHARPRDAWSDADAKRPLVRRGRREAAGLVELLQCWRPERVVSSPWLRCRETLTPYVERTGVSVRWKAGLTEAGHERDPGKARAHVRKLLERDQVSLLCTHRPVLASVVEVLRRAAADDVLDLLPTEDPWLEPAELLVAHVVRPARERPLVVAVERHLPQTS
ncbi:MAG: histidine phosphatase family protein [Kineosporiaceae bacterium]